jgi:predicted ATPase
MAHLTGFGLENFRVFGKETWFDFAPITILTGTNSCGKSSVNKALLLLKDSIKNHSTCEIVFNDDALHKLGDNSRIKNDNNRSVIFKFKINGRIYKGFDKNYCIKIEADTFYESECQHLKNLFYKRITILNENSEKIFEVLFDFHGEYVISDNENSGEKLNQPFLSYKYSDMYYTYNVFFDGILSDVLKNYNSYFNYNLNSSIISEDFYVQLTGLSFDKIKKEVIDIEKEVFSCLTLCSYFPNDSLDLFKELIGGSFGDDEDWDENSRTDVNSSVAEIVDKLSRIYPIIDDSLLKEAYEIEYDFNSENLKNIKRIYKKYIKAYFEQLRDVLQSLYYSNASKIIVNRVNNIHNQDKSFLELLFKNSKSVSQTLDSRDKTQLFINRWSKEFNLSFKIEEISSGQYELKVNDKNIADVGSGYLQIFNIYLLILNNSQNTIIIEEPETNLHPALQSKLADMLVDAVKEFGIRFILETHSEYLIRRLQFLTAKNEIRPEDTIIHYLFDPKSEHTQRTGEQLRTIRIQKDGRLDKEFGTGFFDEADNLALNLYSYNKTQLN